jgi:hypothetical protein
VGLLAMPELEQNLGIARRIRETLGDSVQIYSLAEYPEDVDTLKAAGIDGVWQFGVEAGIGFAEDVIDQLGDTLPERAGA